mmetsp:Transcript_566/g.1531  ORF Transcript_566/g.1531 Transcript_566/m.1531 type:complete len:290 (-) Transcript_566:142-1011(-)
MPVRMATWLSSPTSLCVSSSAGELACICTPSRHRGGVTTVAGACSVGPEWLFWLSQDAGADCCLATRPERLLSVCQVARTSASGATSSSGSDPLVGTTFWTPADEVSDASTADAALYDRPAPPLWRGGQRDTFPLCARAMADGATAAAAVHVSGAAPAGSVSCAHSLMRGSDGGVHRPRQPRMCFQGCMQPACIETASSCDRLKKAAAVLCPKHGHSSGAVRVSCAAAAAASRPLDSPAENSADTSASAAATVLMREAAAPSEAARRSAGAPSRDGKATGEGRNNKLGL